MPCSCLYVGLTIDGSSSRMFSIVPALALIAAAVGFSVALYACTSALPTPYAARVALMLFWMYGDSRTSSVGRTCTDCTNEG